jgi:hypothetical protein
MITAGIPAWRARSAAANAVRGVNSDGLTTTVQPQAKAGPTCPKTTYAKKCTALAIISFFNILPRNKYTAWLETFRVIIANGKFHGVIAPTGCSAKKKERNIEIHDV